MQKYIFILLILFMSCTTEPVDQHDDNAVLQSFFTIGDNDKILSYDMNGNGTVDCMELPDTICVWENGRITQLNLFNMGLSGEMPESIGNLDQLLMLGLNSNQLIGEIPKSIGNLSKLAQLSLGNNYLTGSIPESIGNLTSLFNLNLGNNQLTGLIPRTMISLPIRLSINYHVKQVNHEVGKKPPRESTYKNPNVHIKIFYHV